MNYFQSAGDPNINVENIKEEIINPYTVLPSVKNESETNYSQYKKNKSYIDANYGISYASHITTINQLIIDQIPKNSNLDLVIDFNNINNKKLPVKNEPIFINNEPYKLDLDKLILQIKKILNNDKKNELEFLFNEIRFKSDYIDMVHDFRICFNYIKDIFPEDKEVEWKTIFIDVQQICTANHNINVDKSHELQMEVFKYFTLQLRNNFNLILPDIPDFQVITESNKKSVEYIKTFYRESGRGLDKFLGKNDEENDDTKDKNKNKKQKTINNNLSGSELSLHIPKPIPSNSIGAIDGCPKGQCSIELATKSITWSQNIAGFIDITMVTNSGELNLTNIIVDIKNAGFSMEVNLKDELVLNNILLFLPNEFNKAIRIGSLKNKITIINIKYKDFKLDTIINNINTNGNDTDGNEKNQIIEQSIKDKKLKNLIYTSFISLKTVCDKTVIQLIKDGTLNNKDPIGAICTIDSYVFAVPLIEYLTGNIEYCPTTLCSNKFGYTKFSYETNFIDNNELDGKFIMLYCFANVFTKETFENYKNNEIIVNNENLLNLDEILVIKNYFYNIIENTYKDSIIKKQNINEYLNTIITYIIENILYTNSIITQSKSGLYNSDWNNLWHFFEMKSIFSNQTIWKNKINELSKKIKNIITIYFNNNSNKEVDFQKKLSSEIISIPYILPSLTETSIKLEEQSNILEPISISEYFENLLYNDIYNFELKKLDESIIKEEPNFNSIIGKKKSELSSNEQQILLSIQKLINTTSNISNSILKKLFPKGLHSYNDDEIKNIIKDYENEITNTNNNLENEYKLSFDLIDNEDNLKKLSLYYFGIINNITKYDGIENNIYIKLELIVELKEKKFLDKFINDFNEINDSEYPAYINIDINKRNLLYIFIPYTAELLIEIAKKIININNTSNLSKSRSKKVDTIKEKEYFNEIEETLFNIMKDKYLLNLNEQSIEKFKEFFNYFINVERQKYNPEGNKENNFNESINSVWNRLFSNQEYDNKDNNQIVASELPVTQNNLEDIKAMDTNTDQIYATEVVGQEVEASSPVKKRIKSQQDEEEKTKININNVMDISNKRNREQELEEENKIPDKKLKINNTVQSLDISSPVKKKEEKPSMYTRVMNTFTSKNKRKRTGGVKTQKNKKENNNKNNK
jgi:hypothetical protein